MVTTDSYRNQGRRDVHPALPELVGGLDLSSESLRGRADKETLTPLLELLANAEYWLSFDVGTFEPLLTKTPSPLRELGVGIALRFGENVEGRLSSSDLDSARTGLVERLPDDLKQALSLGLEVLERAVSARDGGSALERDGFAPYSPKKNLSVHALMAGGKGEIRADGQVLRKGQRLRVEIGRPVQLAGFDDRGQPAAAPEIETRTEGSVLARDGKEANLRDVVLLVPGAYRVRVPGKLEGDGFLLAG
jgi:hypothetical protein